VTLAKERKAVTLITMKVVEKHITSWKEKVSRNGRVKEKQACEMKWKKRIATESMKTESEKDGREGLKKKKKGRLRKNGETRNEESGDVRQAEMRTRSGRCGRKPKKKTKEIVGKNIEL